MLKGFKEFISRGNAVDLAVGMVIGAAFTAIVTALVRQLPGVHRWLGNRSARRHHHRTGQLPDRCLCTVPLRGYADERSERSPQEGRDRRSSRSFRGRPAAL